MSNVEVFKKLRFGAKVFVVINFICFLLVFFMAMQVIFPSLSDQPNANSFVRIGALFFPFVMLSGIKETWGLFVTPEIFNVLRDEAYKDGIADKFDQAICMRLGEELNSAARERGTFYLLRIFRQVSTR